MNILMLHPHDIYSNSEPWTVRITYLATEFVKRGHNVRLLYHLIDPRMSLEEATARQEFPFTTIPSYRFQMALVGKMKFVTELARWADVIHFQKCFPHVSIPALWAGYRLGKPVHYDWDDWEWGIYNYNPMNRLVGAGIRVFERMLPRLCDSVSVASEALRRMAIDLGVPENRLFDGHVGGDLERFKPDNDGSRVRAEHHIEGPTVLYLGQLHGAQYLELFLQAVKIVLDSGRTPNFMVVGGGERFGELFQLAETIGVGHHVIFTGAVDHDVVPEYVAAADVAVACFADTAQVATKSPLKVCEYLAAGKAIVASRVGEVPRMVGDAGILVPPGDPAELAQGIIRLLDDEDLRKRLSAKARRRAEDEFNWGATAQNLLTAYEMILDESRWLNWKIDKGQARTPFFVQPSGPPRPIHKSKYLTPKPAEKPLTRSATPAAPMPDVHVAAPPPASGGAPGTNGHGVHAAPEAGFSRVQFISGGSTVIAGGGLQTAASDVVVAIPEDAPFAEPRPLDEKRKHSNGNGNGHGTNGVAKPAALVNGKKERRPWVPNPPKPPHYSLGPLAPLRRFIEGNLDIAGVLDGRVAFIGPHTVQFDPTDTCPHDCIACWCRSPLLVDKTMPVEEQKQRLDFDVLCDVLDDLVRMGTKEIYIAGGGEPMAYPKILPLCERIKEKGLICNINTSFLNVGKKVAHELARMKVDFMTVSVWAASPETYVLTHPNKTEESYWDLRESLTYLNEVKDTVPFIKTYNVLTNLNFHEFKAMVDFAIDTKSESVEFTVVDTMPGRTDSLLLNSEQQRWLYEEALRVRRWIVDDEKEARVQLYLYDQFLRRVSGEHTTVGEHDRLVIDSMPCTVGWSFSRLLANGNVNGCLKSHRIPHGTVHERRFLDIWTGRHQVEFRKKTNVFTKSDPWFSNIGNDPDAKCGCYKSCDDLGRNEHLWGRMQAMPWYKLAVLKAAQLYLRATGQYLKPSSV